MDWKPKATIPTFFGVLYFLLDLPGRWGVLVTVLSHIPPIFHQTVFPLVALLAITIGILFGLQQPKSTNATSGLLDQHGRSLDQSMPTRRSAVLIALTVGAAVLVAGITISVAHHLRGLQQTTTGGQPVTEGQFGILNLSPEQTTNLERFKAPLFRSKAEVLDTQAYRDLIITSEKLRALTESIEAKRHCLVDLTRLVCLPKPPADLSNGSVDLSVSLAVVSDVTSPVLFWVVHDKGSKLRIPIVLFVTLTNHSQQPVTINVVYLEARGVGGWTDVRMADTFSSYANNSMEDRPLVFQAKNGCVAMKGQYLIPSLYDRVIQPGDKVTGWVIAEYPKGVKYNSSIGELRISLAAQNRWVGSKIFAANPPTFGDHLDDIHGDDFYLIPLDTMITEQ